MRFPKLAKKVRRLSSGADTFLEEKWRDWSDIIDRKCRVLADFLDPPREEPKRELYGPPAPYRPDLIRESIREILAQRSDRNALFDAMMREGKNGASGEDGS